MDGSPAIGIHIVPLMPPSQVVRLVTAAEDAGYDACLVADEGLHPDVYVCLGAAAAATSSIRIGPMTNAYTRHPAVTAAGMATLDALSGGRAVVTMLAGGSMTLGPMGLERDRPYRRVADAITLLRSVWTGREVTWAGETCAVDHGQLAGGLGGHDIPIWIASRGPRLLGLAGRQADAVVATVKPDIGAAFAIAEDAARSVGRQPPRRVYLGRMCYTPAMLEGQRTTLSYVLMDSPPRVLAALGLDPDQVALVQRSAATNRPDLVDPLATEDLLARYQVAGTPEQCTAELARMIAVHRLDTILIDVLSDDLDENLAVIADSYPILRGAAP